MKRLTQYDHRLVRAVTADGMTLEEAYRNYKKK